MRKHRLKAKEDTPQEYDEYSRILRKIYNPNTIYRTKKAIELTKNGRGKALSIGVGNSAEASELKKAGFDVTICDISPSAIEFVQEKGFTAFQCDILANSPRGKYDYIFCLEVLEHLVNPLKAIQNLKRSLSKDGLLVISLPNEFNIITRIQILFGHPPFGGHDCHHLRFFNKQTGERLFLDAGLEIINKNYCPRVPLWNRFSIVIGEFLQKLQPSLFSYTTVWLLKPT